jgi:hypothetical protein
MAVTAFWYGNALVNAFGGDSAGEAFAFDWLSDTIKVALLDNGHTPSQDNHDFFDDVEADELANGNGYTTGGATLGSKTLGYTAGTNVIKFDAADTSWTTATFTARYAVIYKSTGTSSTSPLLGYVDFGADVSVTGGTFQITWHSDGILTITVS